jgi:hypothetical protein
MAGQLRRRRRDMRQRRQDLRRRRQDLRQRRDLRRRQGIGGSGRDSRGGEQQVITELELVNNGIDMAPKEPEGRRGSRIVVNYIV